MKMWLRARATGNSRPRASLLAVQIMLAFSAVGAWAKSPGPEAAHPGANEGYRLAGTVLVGDKYLGFLELPQGGQVLVREGSVVNGGRVTAFTAKELRIQFPGHVVELPLEASGRPPTPGRHEVVTRREDMQGGKATLVAVDVSLLGAALDQSATKTSTVPAGSKASGRPVSGDNTSAVIAERFAPLFDLPPGAQVVAINEEPVTTVDAAIRTVEDSLKDQRVARFTIKSSQGETRLYVMPARNSTHP